MRRNKIGAGRPAWVAGASALAIAVSMMAVTDVAAQAANSTLRGTVFDGQSVESGGSVVAREVSTGYVSRGTISGNGGYVLAGLRPGTYQITATSADGQVATDTVVVAIGQVLTLDLDVAPAPQADTGGATELGEIVVVGRRLFETRTPEVATNVSQAQINNLPQINRNFLNFAALAPGVRVTEGETERTISAGGQGAQAINVFIDGQNQKSTILDGGVAGQDDSRGNPFPQAGVQEFRVISQNFKAEYEQAGSSIITAVTRSGTNEFSGDAFVTYQERGWHDDDAFGRPVGPERLQYGASLGGPIIRDRLHFFGAYEKKDETRANSVFITRTEFAPLFPEATGTFDAPFEQDLFFGKLSWQIDDSQLLEVSGTYRTEEDIRDFGNTNAFSRAVSISTDIRSVNVRHQYQGDRFLNEVSYDFFQSTYNPVALNISDFGREFVLFRDNVPDDPANPASSGFQFNADNREATIFSTGGSVNNQYIEQTSHTLRNDLTLYDIDFAGSHTIKIGGKISFQNYYVDKPFVRNPQFIFDVEGREEINGSRDIPVLVRLGGPTQVADVDNLVLGFYIQDDWQITNQLELNLGIRWDYEDNAVNNDWDTPQNIRDMLTALENVPGYDFPSYFNPDDYISNGDRDAFMGAFQPRIGFSYDVFDDERTVIFGGAGRYYDRIGFNFAFDERYKPYQFDKIVYFSRDGGMLGGRETVAWDPSYSTAEGLDPLLESINGAGEVFLVNNDAEPPVTDQFNFGVRQRLGIFQAAATLSYTRTKNLFQWNIANAGAEVGERFSGPTPASVGFDEFRNLVFFMNQGKEARYKALFVTLDKPFTEESGWGFNLAYTLSEAEQNGSRDGGFAAFDFDYNVPEQSPWYPSPSDERHRLVMSGIVSLPLDFQLSGIVTLGSGLPFNVFDCPTAFREDPSSPPICWNEGRPKKYAFGLPDAWAFRQVDLRLTKSFETFNGHELQLIVDAINVFNHENYSGFEGGFNNPNFGQPFAQFLPTRSLQVGLRYAF